MFNIKSFILYILLLSGFSNLTLSATKEEKISDELIKLTRNFVATEEEVKAGAVVLKHDVKHLPNNIGTFDSEYYIAVAILDDNAANDYSHFDNTVNKYFNNLELEFARVITASGKVFTPKKDAIKYYASNSNKNQFYDDLWKLSFSLPKVTPGSFLEYKLRYKAIRPVIENKWWSKNVMYLLKRSRYGFGAVRLDPVRSSTVSVNLPPGKELQGKVRNISNYDYKNFTNNIGKTHKWSLINLKQTKLEKGMPGLYEWIPYIGITTVKDWRDINNWAIKYYNNQPTEPVRKLAEKITSNLNTEKEKIKAIYYYLQKNLRYVSANFNRNGVIPHKPEEVLANGYGDCKDQANLFSVMLRSIGINAHPALINSPNVADSKFTLPTLSFNHMIVFLPNSKKYKWIDLTGDRNLFPGFDPVFENVQVFVINGSGGTLTNTSDSYKEDNRIEVILDYITKSNPLKANIKVIGKGGIGGMFKQIFRGAKNNVESMTSFVQSFHKSAKVLTTTVDSSKDIDQPFIFSGSLEFKDRWDENKKYLYIDGDLSQIIGTLTNLMSFNANSDRQHPVILNQSFILSIRTIMRSPGEDYYFKDIRPGIVHKSNFFNSEILNSQEGKSQIKTLKFQINKSIINKDEYNTFVDDINKAVINSRWTSLYIQDKKITLEKKLLDKSTNSSNANLTLVELKSLARVHINNADYKKAKELVDMSISRNDEDGENYYLLGLVLGYMDEFEKSEEAFNKAKKLGYEEN